MLVVTIISLVIFLVLIHSPRPELHDAAIAVASVTEFSLYTITTVAALVGICQVSTFPSSYFRAISDLSLSHILVKCQAYLQGELYRAFSAKDLRIFDLAEALLSLANIGLGRDGLVNYLMW